MKFNGKFDIIKYVSQLLVAMLMNISVAYRMLLSVIPYKTAFYIDSCAPEDQSLFVKCVFYGLCLSPSTSTTPLVFSFVLEYEQAWQSPLPYYFKKYILLH